MNRRGISLIGHAIALAALASLGGDLVVTRRIEAPPPPEPLPDIKDDRRLVVSEEKRRRKAELRKTIGRPHRIVGRR